VSRPEITGVAGVPETAVSPALVARLPAAAAPAPWQAECEAVVWFHRASQAAAAALAPGLRGRPLVVVGGLVRYARTPVGAYDEVLGMVLSHAGPRPWAHVAFMAVDSEASLVGGRQNWAMPKTLARFDGLVGAGRTFTARGADQAAWRVSATPRLLGPRLPVRARAETRQEFAGGRVGAARMTGRGRARPAVVTVDVASEGPLPAWLRPGRHLGAVLEQGSFSLGAPAFG
jgi:hypothetical protein